MSYAYRNLAPELRVFISPPSYTTAPNLIKILEEKEEIWFNKFHIRATPQRFITSSSLRNSIFNKLIPTFDNQAFSQSSPPQLMFAVSASGLHKKAPLPSQSEAFYRYRAQQASLTWQTQQSSSSSAQPPIFFIPQKTSGPQQPLIPYERLRR